MVKAALFSGDALWPSEWKEGLGEKTLKEKMGVSSPVTGTNDFLELVLPIRPAGPDRAALDEFCWHSFVG